MLTLLNITVSFGGGGGFAVSIRRESFAILCVLLQCTVTLCLQVLQVNMPNLCTGNVLFQ